MEEIDATTARRSFRSILDRARIDGEPTCITRHGERVAVLVPAGTWDELNAAAGFPAAQLGAAVSPDA